MENEWQKKKKTELELYITVTYFHLTFLVSPHMGNNKLWGLVIRLDCTVFRMSPNLMLHWMVIYPRMTLVTWCF